LFLSICCAFSAGAFPSSLTVFFLISTACKWHLLPLCA
jgi:hypothetical protein